MQFFAQFENATGRVVKFLQLSNDALPGDQRVPPDQCLLELVGAEQLVANTDTHMVDGNYLVERPKLFAVEAIDIAADGVEEVRQPIPAGTVVIFQLERHIAESDEDFEFSTAIHGEFVFSVRPPFPYQPQTVTVIANAP